MSYTLFCTGCHKDVPVPRGLSIAQARALHEFYDHDMTRTFTAADYNTMMADRSAAKRSTSVGTPLPVPTRPRVSVVTIRENNKKTKPSKPNVFADAAAAVKEEVGD